MSEVQLFADASVVCPSCGATGPKAILVRPHRWPHVLGMDARLVMGLLGAAVEKLGQSEQTRKGWGALRKAAMDEVVAEMEENGTPGMEEPVDRYACTGCGHTWTKAAAPPSPPPVPPDPSLLTDEPPPRRRSDVLLVQPESTRRPVYPVRPSYVPLLVVRAPQPALPVPARRRKRARRAGPLLPSLPSSPSRAQRRTSAKVLIHKSRLGTVRWHAVRGQDFTLALGARCDVCGARAGHLCRIEDP